MKKILALCFSILSCFYAGAQAKDPVVWTTAYHAISAAEGEIIITANIEKGWHIYSQEANDAGPVPTSFMFDKNKSFEPAGKAAEIGAHEIFDAAFDAKVSSFSGKAEFRQKIKLAGKPGFVVPFKVEYMCCDDKMCLPPKTIALSVKVQ